MKLASLSNIKLTNVEKNKLDELHAIANAPAKPLKSVTPMYPDDPNVTVVVTDTIGSMFPKSYAGNRTAQTSVPQQFRVESHG